MTPRLEHVAPDLVLHIRAAPAVGQRRIAFAAARRAVVDAGLDDPLVDSVLAAGSADAGLVDHFRRQVTYLDEQALSLQELVDDGRASRDHEIAFARARAAAAVAYALDEDPLAAALDAVYEAWHAVDDTAGLVRVVENSGEER